MTATNKAMTVSLGISTDMRIDDKYYLDMRDVSNGRNRQMGVRHGDAPEMLRDINHLMDLSATHGVTFKAIDLGHDDLNILKFRCGECGHYMIDAAALLEHTETH